MISDENNMLVTCTFSGAPPPWVTWKKNGEVIEVRLELSLFQIFYTNFSSEMFIKAMSIYLIMFIQLVKFCN